MVCGRQGKIIVFNEAGWADILTLMCYFRHHFITEGTFAASLLDQLDSVQSMQIQQSVTFLHHYMRACF